MIDRRAALESLLAQQKRCRQLPDDHKPHLCKRCRRHAANDRVVKAAQARARQAKKDGTGPDAN